jgi:hypothetical protein
MLIFEKGWEPMAKLHRELKQNPGIMPVLEAFQSAGERFEVAMGKEGLELVPLDPVRGQPNRCRIKLFRPRPASERLCAFFYKKSNLQWSHDRMSYGGVEFLPENVDAAEARTWVQWLVTGLDPEKRPERHRRAFLYDVPD